MKKLFILSLFLTACARHYDNTKGAVISHFESIGQGCFYHAEAIAGADESIRFIDSCGKYMIGDTIYICKP